MASSHLGCRLAVSLLALSCGWLQPWTLGANGGRIGSVALAETDAVFAPVPTSANSDSVTAGSQKLKPQHNLDELPYFPGRIVLTLDNKLAVKVMRNRSRLGSPDAQGTLGVPELDRLNHRNGFRSMRQPFAARAARRKKQLARFRQRAARAPAGASAPKLENIYILELSRFLDMEKVARQYAEVPGVAWAEPDRKVEAFFLTDGPFLSSTGSWKQSFADLWGIHIIDAPQAWDVTTGTGVVIAIADTGIDRTHPDIESQIWTNPGEIPGNGIDDDGNGYVDDDNDPSDDHGHGTPGKISLAKLNRVLRDLGQPPVKRADIAPLLAA